MAATKAQKAPNRQPNVHAQPTPRSPPPEPAVNGKKKKKKKGKAKGADPNLPANPSFPDDDEDLPQLEAVTSPPPNPGSPRSIHRTGLSPELESVHLSTTASLSASAAATARLNATAAAQVAQAELIATANDLYRRMDTPDEDDYWSSMPSHIKNFVKMTYNQSTNPNVNQNERAKAQSMFAIAQQMIDSGANRMSPKSGQAQPPGAYPSSLPFDPSIFSDPAFNHAMEQTLAATGPLPPAPGQPPRGPLPPTNVVLLNEFGGGEDGQAMEDDYYSEDEVDENVDEPEIDGDVANSATFVGYDNGMFGPAVPQSQGGGEGDGGKKKSKKKKKKGGVQTASAPVPIPVAQLPAPVPNPNPPTPLPAPTVPMPASRPPPATTTHSAPLTSSRAAGKQPMSYTAPAPAAAPPSTRTSRSASKAPLPAHPYSHAHHHPSPPSSQTSNKTRPPAAPPKSSKLWSTNSTEERERIKEFWLGLGEEERRALVKVEKEAVLKKMKEQQKHSCSCAVCGRKRCVVSSSFCSAFGLSMRILRALTFVHAFVVYSNRIDAVG
jgi:ribosomal protein S14